MARFRVTHVLRAGRCCDSRSEPEALRSGVSGPRSLFKATGRPEGAKECDGDDCGAPHARIFSIAMMIRSTTLRTVLICRAPRSCPRRRLTRARMASWRLQALWIASTARARRGIERVHWAPWSETGALYARRNPVTARLPIFADFIVRSLCGSSAAHEAVVSSPSA